MSDYIIVPSSRRPRSPEAREPRNPEALRQVRPSLDRDISRIRPSEAHEGGRLVSEWRPLTEECAEARVRLQATRDHISRLEERAEHSRDGMVRMTSRAELEIAREREKEQAREVARLSGQWQEIAKQLDRVVSRHDAIVVALRLNHEVRGDYGSSLTSARVRELVAESLSLVGPRLAADDAPRPTPAPRLDPGLLRLDIELGNHARR